MIELEATSTHLYPGARVHLASGAEAIAASGQDVVLTFADHSRAAGRLSGDLLMVEGYETAAGREIDAGAWSVALDEGSIKIRRRALGT